MAALHLLCVAVITVTLHVEFGRRPARWMDGWMRSHFKVNKRHHRHWRAINGTDRADERDFSGRTCKMKCIRPIVGAGEVSSSRSQTNCFQCELTLARQANKLSRCFLISSQNTGQHREWPHGIGDSRLESQLGRSLAREGLQSYKLEDFYFPTEVIRQSTGVLVSLIAYLTRRSRERQTGKAKNDNGKQSVCFETRRSAGC